MPPKKPASAKQRARALAARAARRSLAGLPDPVRERLAVQQAARRAHKRQQRLAAELLERRVFDRGWYEAQTGIAFASGVHACVHYLDAGRAEGHSPHPLFEPSLAQPLSWQSANVDPLVSVLRGRVKRTSVTHPALPTGWDRPAVRGGRAQWLDWVATAGPDTPMPPPGDRTDAPPMTWGAFRERALHEARELAEVQRITDLPRVTRVEPVLTVAADLPVAVAEPGRPVVSVVMPTWNRGAVVRTAIESVRQQTLAEWELLVVDDGSDDDTLTVLRELAAADDRIRVFAEPHVGVCHARNVGIANARGRFVAFLDSDNTWTPDFLRGMTGFLQQSGATWAHAVMELIRNDGVYYRAYEGDHDSLLGGNYIDLNVLVATRAVLDEVGGFDESLRRAVDYDLVLRLSALHPPRLVPLIGAVYSDDEEDESRISVVEPYRWSTIVRLRHWTNRARLTERPTVPGRVSVVVPVRGRPAAVARLTDQLRAGTRDRDVEIIVVSANASLPVQRPLRLARARRGDDTELIAISISQLFGALDYGTVFATGEYVVAWSPNCLPDDTGSATDDWLAPLLDALADPAVAVAQPLQLHRNGLIASAGGVFAGADPYPSGLLADLPVTDAAGLTALTGPTVVPTLRADVVAVRTETLRAAGGFDLWFGSVFGEADLALRARDLGLGEPVVVPASRVVATDPAEDNWWLDVDTSAALMRSRHTAAPGSDELWRATGFEVTGARTFPLESDVQFGAQFGTAPIVRPRRVESVVEGVPALRWAIDTAAPAGPRAKLWGDTFFGEALAAALRRLGQQVHVDNRNQRDQPHRDLDDVTLVLRGLYRPGYRPGSTRLMWIISHPDLVTAAECAQFDRVFAASEPWSAARSEQWGTPIEPLLQCTDGHLFTPDAAEPDTGLHKIVFVGNSRNVTRPSLLHVIAAGQSPAVFGGGWAGVIDEEFITAGQIANTALPELYASAGLVLNDHWADMRDNGFVSNRVFDVLACGARLLTDDAVGIGELFGSRVTVFRDAADVARIFADDDWRAHFADRETRLETAAIVRAEHTFDTRARQLLDAALQARSQPRS